MLDKYYTPKVLAEKMISALPCNFVPKNIADFSAGQGSLLEVASFKWGKAEIIANDWCKPTTRDLKKFNKKWVVSCSDFMNDGSVNRSNLKKYKGKLDLVLLNPPFSQRGLKLIEVLNGKKCGLAMAFTLKALSFLKKDGFAVVILPDGSLNSNRDEVAREFLEKNYIIRVVQKNSNNSFLGVSAQTSILMIQNRKPFNRKNVLCNAGSCDRKKFSLYRGRFQMHKLSINLCKKGIPLIHSTSLKKGLVCVDDNIRVQSDSFVEGPCVMFPRVGNISREKISVLLSNQAVVLSDCVIAIACNSDEEVLLLREDILSEWEAFLSLYSGTGAKYITMNQVAWFLEYKINFTGKGDVYKVS